MRSCLYVTDAYVNKWARSKSESSSINFSLDEFVEFLPWDGLNSVTSNRVDDFNKLIIRISVFELFINVSQIVEIKFSFSLDVQ